MIKIKDKKVVIGISLLFLLCASIFVFEYTEERKAEVEAEEYYQSCERYEELVLDDLIEIRDLALNFEYQVNEVDVELTQTNYLLGMKSAEFLDDYKDYISGNEGVDEKHEEIVTAVKLLKDGAVLFDTCWRTVLAEQRVSQKIAEDKFVALDDISLGHQRLGELLENLRYQEEE